MNTNTKITDKKEKAPLFSGVATALITPFRDDAIDYPSLTSLIDFQIENGVSAIVLLGTTGEAPTVTETERERKYALYKFRRHTRRRRRACRNSVL